jgi:hypothetical protein
MRSRSFPLTLDCEGCCVPARLKLINAYPFTKGVTETTYACTSCGHTMKLAVQIPESGGQAREWKQRIQATQSIGCLRRLEWGRVTVVPFLEIPDEQAFLCFCVAPRASSRCSCFVLSGTWYFGYATMVLAFLRLKSKFLG